MQRVVIFPSENIRLEAMCREADLYECICTERKCFVASKCLPSSLCRNGTSVNATGNSVIAIPVLCHKPADCVHQNVILRRLLLSLLAVNTTLPVFVITPNASFFNGHATILHHEMKHAPTWAAPYHKASFYKLEILSMAQFPKVIVLDTDMQVVQNIDHLRNVQTPAFVVHRPDTGINTGLQVLRPDMRDYERASRLMAGKKKRTRDGSDQEVIYDLYGKFYELPLLYNARPHFQPVSRQMCDAKVLHNYDARKHKAAVSRHLYLNECRR